MKKTKNIEDSLAYTIAFLKIKLYCECLPEFNKLFKSDKIVKKMVKDAKKGMSVEGIVYKYCDKDLERRIKNEKRTRQKTC